MGVLAIDDVRRHHGAGADLRRPHGGGPVGAVGLPRREQQTALSQIGLAAFGDGAPFYLLQAFTAAILVLAANTAFNGFPVLSSLLGPRRLPPAPALAPRRPARLLERHPRCSRVASLLIVAFDAEVTRLIQLYILGVFLSFTLSQAGHGPPLVAPDRRRARASGAALRRKQAINGAGAVVTGLVFVIVLVTKFAAGRVDRRARGADPVRGDEGDRAPLPPSRAELAPTRLRRRDARRVHAVVLVSNLLAPTLRALAFAAGDVAGDAARRQGRPPRTRTTRCRGNGRSAACRSSSW